MDVVRKVILQLQVIFYLNQSMTDFCVIFDVEYDGVYYLLTKTVANMHCGT